ncbi:MAG: GNAT family N-acetyltransferase [Bacilli bacterium]
MEYEVKVSEKSLYIGESPLAAIAALDYYINRKGIIVATHTEVSKEHRGKGLAVLLFKRLIALAEEKDTKILPYCSYISEMLDKPEYSIYLYKKF